MTDQSELGFPSYVPEPLRTGLANPLPTWEERSRGRYEEVVVKLLLKTFDLEKAKWALLREAEQRHGKKSLRLDIFHETFPGCPYVCRVFDESKPVDHSWSFGRMMQEFTASPLVEGYLAALSILTNTSQPLALFAPWQGQARGVTLYPAPAMKSRTSCQLSVYIQESDLQLFLIPANIFSENLFDLGWKPGSI